MLLVISFLTDEPPAVGRRDYNRDDLHITYLNYALLTPRKTETFLAEIKKIAARTPPLTLELEPNITMLGDSLDIPAKLAKPHARDIHTKLNASLVEAVERSAGKTVSNYAFIPHVSRASKLQQITIEHISVIQHDKEVGVGTHNLANFYLTGE